MRRILFFDIDNTLLDHQTKAIPRSALRAIEALRKAGHCIVIATGRSHEHAKPFVEQLQPSYVITLNGARILRNGHEVLTVPLPRAALVDLFDWLHGQGHSFGVNQGRTCYLSARDPLALAPLHEVGIAIQTHDPFYLHQDVHQGWLFFDEALDTRLFPAILDRYPEFDLVRWHKSAVDVLPRATNKWTGCQWVMAQTGFSPEQAIAFGDGLNDMEMLHGVGLGIAMDNGHPALKAIAQRIAPALHLDGIAAVLKELFQVELVAPASGDVGSADGMTRSN